MNKSIQKFQNSGKIPAFVTNPTGAVQLKMKQEWLKRNPQTAVKDLGYIQTIPGVTVYGAKDEETDKYINRKEFTPKDRELWYENNAPKIKKVGLYGNLRGINVPINNTIYLNKDYLDLDNEINNTVEKIKQEKKIINDNQNRLTTAYLDSYKNFLKNDTKHHQRWLNKYDSQKTTLENQPKELFYSELGHSKDFRDQGYLKTIPHLLEGLTKSIEDRYEKKGNFEHNVHKIVVPQLIIESKKPTKNTSVELVKFKKSKLNKGGKLFSFNKIKY